MVYFSASPSDSVRHSSFHQAVNGSVLYYMFTLYLIAFRADTKSMLGKVLKATTHMRTGTSGSHASEHRSVAVGREGIVLRIPILIPKYLLQVEKCPIFHFFFLIRNHSFGLIFFSTNLEKVLRSSFMSNFEYNISKTFNSLSSVFAHMASSCGKFATKWSVYNIRKEYNWPGLLYWFWDTNMATVTSCEKGFI